MSFTFKNYIENYDSGYITLFKQYIPLNSLPDRVCSSKCIYNILRDELHLNSFKQKIFRETFSEYFRIKIGGGYAPQRREKIEEFVDR
jgi:hypothetical protein